MSEELLDEVEALNSIYGEGTLIHDDNDDASASANGSFEGPDPNRESVYVLRLPGGASSLRLGFSQAYPATAPPSVLGTEHSSGGVRGAGARDLALFRDVLGRAYEPGAVCLFDAMEEFARVRAEEEEEEAKGEGGGEEGRGGGAATHGEGAEKGEGEEEDDGEGEGGGAAMRRRRRGGIEQAGDAGDGGGGGDDDEEDEARVLASMEAPPWVRSEPITENKSTFVSHVARVTSPRQARLYLSHLLASDKRIRSATHNISAWRIRGGDSNNTNTNNNTTATKASNASNNSKEKSSGGSSSARAAPAAPAAVVYQDCDDDGETAAGSRLLHLMQVMELWDAMVVVTRWYGGVKLGPRRFAVINAAARDGFVRAGMVAEGGGGGGGSRDKDKDRKKGR
ncbi:hypothetical protein JDV02_005050 [Purpureocillium takamizusanense]|uniref:RWD domain-containing protein n=1 Tax=Purpureocillium takamizusanense TaxID=2060973 RepID=A0A9Q8QHL4_9HYPO|nr:uncharacterized protein JDV02_005050 [Purpureocillium takamizusanense]UNI18802.1 hypothetical protein JDV02_005050 [Purpureocillium takamizusanense]